MIKTPTYEDALKLATEYHAGQKRWSGEDFITHPIAVADKFEDPMHKIVAVLHDTVEDTKLTLEKLRELGYPPEIVRALFHLTHNKKRDNYLDYILCVADSPTAVIIKIQDLKHNMSDLKEGSLKDKYRMALWILTN